MKTNLSLFGSSSLRGGGRVLDPICTMSLYLPFFGFDGAPKPLNVTRRFFGTPCMSQIPHSAIQISVFITNNRLKHEEIKYEIISPIL